MAGYPAPRKETEWGRARLPAQPGLARIWGCLALKGSGATEGGPRRWGMGRERTAAQAPSSGRRGELRPAPPLGAALAAPDARTRWRCQLRTKDRDSDRRRAPPPGLTPPGAPSPEGRARPWPRTCSNLAARGARGRRPLTCAAIKDRSMVSLLPPALESSLSLPLLSSRPHSWPEKATQRAGVLETARHPRQLGGGGRSRARAVPCSGSELSAGGGRVGGLEPGGGAGLGLGGGTGRPST